MRSLALLFILLSLISFSGCSEKDFKLSDSEYVSIAKSAPISNQFMEKYPDANIYVDRSGSLAVDFMIYDYGAIIMPGTADYPEVPASLRLRVFIDPILNAPTTAFIDCRPSQNSYLPVDKNLDGYLKTETCLNLNKNNSAERMG